MESIEQFRHATVSQPLRMETIVETLAHLQGDEYSLAALAHEARNMGMALGLYCELLGEPGVLAQPFQHYARELKVVAAASRRLMENLDSAGACFRIVLPVPQCYTQLEGRSALRPQFRSLP